MEFEYYLTQAYVGNLNIDDIGNVVIEAKSAVGAYYYLFIITNLGQTHIVMYGPSIDTGLMPDKVNCTYDKISFDSKRISKTIKAFLNNSSYDITDAKIVTSAEALSHCTEILQFIADDKNL